MITAIIYYHIRFHEWCSTMKRSYRVTDDGLKEIQVTNKKQFPCSPTTQPEEFTQQDINDLLHALELPDKKNFEEWNTRRKEDISTIPTFAMEDEHSALMNCMDEIIMAHRCKKCYVFLCCASHVYHHPNCWFTHRCQGSGNMENAAEYLSLQIRCVPKLYERMERLLLRAFQCE